MKTFDELRERALTPAEKKKREDVAKAIERDNPDMPMAKKMAIATSTAKKASESVEESTDLQEETAFRVSIEGLPNMFMYGSGPGQVLAKLRKIVKQPSMIQDVERVTKATVKKSFRLKAQGRDEEEMDEATQHDPKHVKQAIGIASDPRYKKGNMTGASNAINKLSPGLSDHPQVKAVLRRQNESVQEANDKTGADWEKSFTKKLKYSTSDNPKVKSYLAKKQDQRTARNKSMDPGAAKKGLAISVIDRGKAYDKGKKKGIGVMDIDTRPGKDHKTGKSNYGKKLPESVQEKSGLSTKTLGSYVSKASDASKHRGMPTKKVDNRYAGVSKASKELDQREATTVPGMTAKASADRLALIKRIAQKRNKAAADRAQADAKRAIKKDKYLNRDMDDTHEAVDHSSIISRAQKGLSKAEKNNDQQSIQKHRDIIKKHQMQMAQETWSK